MLKKSLLTVAFIATAVILTGCSLSGKKPAADVEAPAVEVQQTAETDKNAEVQKATDTKNTAEETQKNDEIKPTIVTKELPKENASGHTDKAKPGYIKLNPHFDPNYPHHLTQNITWVKDGLGSKIPAFPKGNLLEVINTDTQFLAYIGGVDEDMFRKYTITLTDAGYHYYDYRIWDNLSLYNEKYEVNLRFSQDGYKVTTLRARILTPSEAVNAKASIEKENAARAKK